jgi:flagellum-specific peptidoglycan hydrolase FlgJ
MTTQLQKDFLAKALSHAQLAGHLFPEYAACEAALESAWGNSTLCRQGNNVFGQKQSRVPIYETLTIPTQEVVNGEWVTVSEAHWVKFPSWKESFESRMATIRRLAPEYAGYQDALHAQTGEDFVMSVSRNWSTDPMRGQKVLSIHKAHFTPIGEIR